MPGAARLTIALASLVPVVLTWLHVPSTGLLGVALATRLTLVSLGLLPESLAMTGCLLPVPARWLGAIPLAGLLTVAWTLTLAPAGATWPGATRPGVARAWRNWRAWSLSLPGRLAVVGCLTLTVGRTARAGAASSLSLAGRLVLADRLALAGLRQRANLGGVPGAVRLGAEVAGILLAIAGSGPGGLLR